MYVWSSKLGSRCDDDLIPIAHLLEAQVIVLID
jgi:hypothetical protein